MMSEGRYSMEDARSAVEALSFEFASLPRFVAQKLVSNRITVISTMTEEGRIIALSERAKKIFKYPKEQEILGKPVEILIPIRFRDQHKQDRIAYNRNPTSRVMGLTVQGLCSDGEELLFVAELEPIQVGSREYVATILMQIPYQGETLHG